MLVQRAAHHRCLVVGACSRNRSQLRRALLARSLPANDAGPSTSSPPASGSHSASVDAPQVCAEVLLHVCVTFIVDIYTRA